MCKAGLLGDRMLRTLDAIHIVGAISLDVDGALIYDKRMRAAAVDHGLRVYAPGDETWASGAPRE